MSALKPRSTFAAALGAGVLALSAQSAWAGEVKIGSAVATVQSVDPRGQLGSKTISDLVKKVQQGAQAQQQQQQRQQAEGRLQPQ